MNTINAGNPSANNMLTRQVMQKKRESSATIFDKLTKRTAQLTAQNPLNNILTNDQLFRYYIKEVEPRLSQSNDNFQGLPNTTPQTPPDNSIKDTVEKSYGNVKDEYNAGFSGNGVKGIFNSNDINSMTLVRLSDPQITVYDPNQFNYSSFNAYMQGFPLYEQSQILQNLYNNHKQDFDLFVEGQLKEAGEEVNDKNRAKLLNVWIDARILADKYINTEELHFTEKVEAYDEILRFLGSMDSNAYHQESAIMLNVLIDQSSTNVMSSILDTRTFFYNLWNEWYGQTTLERSIQDIWNIWSDSENTPLHDVITEGFNTIFEKRDIESFQYGEFRDLIFDFINRHRGHSAMAVKTYKTELAKYTLDKMTPNEACKAKKDHYQEELRLSTENHARRLQQYARDDEGDDQQNLTGAQYDDDGFGNLHLVGQRKDPSTHPSKPQELKNPATKVAPVSAQSVKNDAVILRSSSSFVTHNVKLTPSRVLNINPDSY